MPSKVYVQLKDVSKPSVVENGDAVDVKGDSDELTVSDATGERLGWFKHSSVVGWWIERTPNDPRNLSPKDIERIAAEIQKHGMVADEEPSTQ